MTVLRFRHIFRVIQYIFHYFCRYHQKIHLRDAEKDLVF